MRVSRDPRIHASAVAFGDLLVRHGLARRKDVEDGLVELARSRSALSPVLKLGEILILRSGLTAPAYEYALLLLPQEHLAPGRVTAWHVAASVLVGAALFAASYSLSARAVRGAPDHPRHTLEAHLYPLLAQAPVYAGGKVRFTPPPEPPAVHAGDSPLLEGLAALARLDGEGAESALTRHIEGAPPDPAVLAWRAQARRLRGHYREALEDATRALELEPGAASSMLTLGILHYENRSLGAAQRELERAVERDPGNPWARHYLGLVHLDRKDFHRAEAVLARAVDRDPDFLPSLNTLGNVKAALRKSAEAEALYSRALRLNPRFARAYRNRGLLYRDLKRYPEAERDFTRSIELEPAEPRGYEFRARLRARLGRWAEALEDFERAVRLNPDKPGLRAELEDARLRLPAPFECG